VSSKIVLQKRLEDREGLQERMVLEVGDPRRISKSIAPISPPRTEQLAQENKSRFKDWLETYPFGGIYSQSDNSEFLRF
jgi:hypothetical protein